MNFQELFDKSVAGVINQGCKSWNDNVGCVYRGPNGTKCAVGHLIKDEHYLSELEDQNMKSPIVHKALSDSGIFVNLDTQYFLSSLQSAHDGVDVNDADFVGKFKSRAKHVAQRYNLIWKFD